MANIKALGIGIASWLRGGSLSCWVVSTAASAASACLSLFVNSYVMQGDAPLNTKWTVSLTELTVLTIFFCYMAGIVPWRTWRDFKHRVCVQCELRADRKHIINAACLAAAFLAFSAFAIAT